MTRWRPWIVVIALLAAPACGSSGSSKVDVMPKDELHSDMWTLAELTSELDTLMREQGNDVRQDEVVKLLSHIERVSERLAQPSNRKKHPLMEEEIDGFKQRAMEARIAAAGTPPNYYLAGALAGACIYCHDPRGGIR